METHAFDSPGERISLLLQKITVSRDENDAELPHLLFQLGDILFERSQGPEGHEHDLEAALRQMNDAIAAAPDDHSDRPEMFAKRAAIMIRWFHNTKLDGDRDAAIESAEEAFSILPARHTKLPVLQADVAQLYAERSGLTGNKDDLDAATAYVKRAIDISQDDSQLFELLDLDADLAFVKYTQSNELADLEVALEKKKQAETLLSDGDPRLKLLYKRLSMILYLRFKHTQNLDDLEAAKAHVALENLYDRLKDEKWSWISAWRRYSQTHHESDIDAAISHAKTIIKLLPTDSPERPGWQAQLCNMYITQYRQFGGPDKIGMAITAGNEALDANPDNGPIRALALSSLSGALECRYIESGDPDDLNSAISKMDEAEAVGHPNQDYQAMVRGKLGEMLRRRFDKTYNVADIQQALSRMEESLGPMHGKSASRAHRLHSIAFAQFQLYERNGVETVLKAAISNSQNAIDALPAGESGRSAMLGSLGLGLLFRYKLRRHMDDLDAAILKTKEAIAALPEDCPNRAVGLSNLANMLATRYEQNKHNPDNLAAMKCYKEALALTSGDVDLRAGIMGNLTGRLVQGYYNSSDISELDAALSTMEEALEDPSIALRVRILCLINLALVRYGRYDWSKDATDLDKSISAASKAVEAAPEDYPEGLLKAHLRLGLALKKKSELEDSAACLDKALEHFRTASMVPRSDPRERSSGACRAMEILCEKNCWKQAGILANTALDLLPRVCNRMLSLNDQQHAIEEAVNLPSLACSISLKAGNCEEALQQIEFGRGLILGYLIDRRSDLSELQAKCPSLAQKYHELRAMASRNASENTDIEDALESCEQEIRQIDGFQSFLLRPPISELMEAASDGPIVIINLSRYGEEAIIISMFGLYSLELPKMKLPVKLLQHVEAVKSGVPPEELTISEKFSILMLLQRAESSQSEQPDSGPLRNAIPQGVTNFDFPSLELLWHTCVHPVLESMRERKILFVTSDKEPPRVWWIGAGAAAHLPFHAAAASFDRVSTDSCLRQVISSYTPTIKALKHARARALGSKGSSETENINPSIMVVTMPSTPGHERLNGVNRERDAIQEAVKSAYKVDLLEQPTADEVLIGLKTSQIAHFACHGSTDTNPLQSCLMLQRQGAMGPELDRLTVESLLAQQAGTQAWVAYLSACSTADLTPSGDESLHLASAFQVAGFAHVIGSAMPVDDDICVQVTKTFYEYLSQHSSKNDGGRISNRNIAGALRHAVLLVAEEFPDKSSLWAPFLHYGA